MEADVQAQCDPLEGHRTELRPLEHKSLSSGMAFSLTGVTCGGGPDSSSAWGVHNQPI